jgi:hypothetical protein
MWSSMRMTSLKKNNIVIAGWFVAVLLFLATSLFGAYTTDDLYKKYAFMSFDQLMGEYNDAVELHDSIRARTIAQLPKDTVEAYIKQDDEWCRGRNVAWTQAMTSHSSEVLINIVVLEYLRCGTMLEKSLASSSEN